MSQQTEDLTLLKIKAILRDLSQKENFLCEKRLVYEFAKLLEQSGYSIFLEYPIKHGSKYMYEDIRVEAPNGIFVFEIKYCPSNIYVTHGSMSAYSRYRSSISKRIQNFIQDVKRTQQTIKSDSLLKGGFCIFLTNQKGIINGINQCLDKLCKDLTLEPFNQCKNKSKELSFIILCFNKS